MKIEVVDCIPKGKSDIHADRRARARQLLIDAKDSGAETFVITDTENEYPSITRMRQIFCEEAARAARIIRQRLGLKDPRYPTMRNTVFKIKVVAGKMYVEITKVEVDDGNQV